MKKIWIAVVAAVAAFVLLRVGCSIASNQRLVNKLNPVWEVQGHAVSEQGVPISDVALSVSYSIGYYPIGRLLEQSAGIQREVLKPDTNGFFSIRRQCSDIFIRVDDARYKIMDSRAEADEVVFSEHLPSSHTTSDKAFKLVLKRIPQ